MDYEKAYKEALERAKEIQEHTQGIDLVSKIFPELAESEDEKMRKHLVKYLQYLLKGAKEQDDAGCNRQKDIEAFKWGISWLEKQKPLETPQWMIDFLDEHRKHFGTPMDHDERRDVDGKLLAIVEWLKGNPNIEQKELKIIPRFRVGDLVRSKVNSLLTYKVLEVGIINELGNPDYKVELFTNGKPDILNIEVSKMDKWGELVEQKPADNVKPKFKVGDWIINNDKRIAVPTQILEIEEYGYVTSSGYTSFDKVKTDYHLWTIQDVKDGDVLANCNIICIFKSIDEAENITPYCIYTKSNGFEILDKDDYIGHFCLKLATKEDRELLFTKMKEAGYEWDAEKKELKKIEQKPEWSEEDENTRNKIIGSLDALKIYVERNNEFDAERIESNLKELDNEIEWLQDIVPQPNQEWSEEDEKILNGLIISLTRIGASTRTDSTSVNYTFTREIDWLKSLKPSWKPSEEQLKALRNLLSGSFSMDNSKTYQSIDSLYNDLEKL